MANTSSSDRQPYHLIGCWTRYSSWTARVTVLLDYYSIPYTQELFNLSPESKAKLNVLSPTGLVPVLIDPTLPPDLRINDSLSIILHLVTSHPELPLLPADPSLRALALSSAAEMHSGFTALRDEFTANFIGSYGGDGVIPISEAAMKDVERLLQLWDQARKWTIERKREGADVRDEGWLFGEFGVADAMFWPVLWRFRTYNLPLTSATPEALTWMAKFWSDEKIKVVQRGYYLQAENPETLVEKYEDTFRHVSEVKYGRFEESWVFDPSGESL